MQEANDALPDILGALMPKGSVCNTLWDCLHDGEIIACKEDRIARTVELEILVSHLPYRERELRISVLLTDVTAALLQISEPYPINDIDNTKLDRHERSAAIDAYWAKARIDSIRWQEFQQSVDDSPLDIYDADLVTAPGKTGLRITGGLSGDPLHERYCELNLIGTELKITRNTGAILTVDALREMGREYWDAFSRNGPAKATGGEPAQ